MTFKHHKDKNVQPSCTKNIMEGYGRATNVLERGNESSRVVEELRIACEEGKLYDPNFIVVKLLTFVSLVK